MEGKSKFSFLPKRKKKVKNEIKLISQKKMNGYFLGGLIGLVALCVLTVFIAFTRTVNSGSSEAKTQVVAKKTDDVDNRLQLFLDSYVYAYFNYVEKDSEAYQKKLASYYSGVPVVKNQSSQKLSSKLVSYKLVSIENGLATYRVTYETNGEKVTVLFGVYYGGKDGQYYVSDLPYFKALEDYKSKDTDKMSGLTLNETDEVSEEDRQTIKTFLELFFKNYTTSQENLDIVAKNVKAINGAIFKGIDYTYFKIKKGDRVIAYVQASFEILGTVHSENFTLEMQRKEDGSFFVEKMEYRIPLDYFKK